MSTGKRIIQKTTAMLLIFILTLAEFALVGQVAISYAVDAVRTNNKNVEISAYFENENGEKIANIESAINANLKLIAEITVKNENGLGGYFDGNISLDNSNFKFKDEENTNIHVNAGDTKRIEKEVQYAEKSDLNVSYLSQETKINVNGKYVNSKKEYDIKGETAVTVNWKSQEDAETQFSADILTNSVYTQGEENKRIVQILVRSKLKDNSYPVKNANIDLSVPDGVENVSVNKRTTNATNGNKNFGEENYTYNQDTKTLTINVENNEENGIISWNKNTYDMFVVTYVYPDSTDLTDNEISAKCKITTYDEKEFEAESNTKIEKTLDGIVTSSIIENENRIYKGKIYTGENRNYTTTTQTNIDYIEPLKDIEINENKVVFVSGDDEINANIQYEKTIINKQEFDNLFGENGEITITDQNENVVADITKDSSVDENGNIVISYGSEVTSLAIKTTTPISKGILNIKHEKKILEQGLSRKQIQSLTGIKESISTIYNKDGEQQNTVNNSKVIDLEETSTKAKLEMETTSLSTTGENQNVNLKITLEANNESKDLYKNPVIKITFPSQITGISAKYAVLYSNGLTKKQAKIVEENGNEVMIIEMAGEQEKYSSQAVDGTIIELNANVKLNNLAVSSKEEITVEIQNENAVNYVDDGIEKLPINIVSENSMILTNNAENSKVSTFGSDEQKEVKLENNAEKSSETISTKIINNEQAEISNVSILGKIPSVDGKIGLAENVKANKNSKIYYTNSENPTIDLNDEQNGWTEENISNPKNYLVVVDNMKHGEELDINYNLDISSNLGYNVRTVEKYNVYYTNTKTGIETNIDSSEITFTTGTVAVISQNVKMTVGKDEIKNDDEVKAGEIIKYDVSIVNDGYEKAENVVQKIVASDGAKLMQVNPKYLDSSAGIDDIDEDATVDENEVSEEYPYFVDVAENQITTENITVDAKQTVNYTYYVKVATDLSDGAKTGATIETKYNDETKNETMTNTVKSANVSAELVPLDRFETETLESNYNYLYKLTVKNNTNKDLKNIDVTLNKNDLTQIQKITYTNGTGEDAEVVEVDTSKPTFTIEKLSAGEGKEIVIDTKTSTPKADLKATEIYATVSDKKDNVVRSNSVSEKVDGIVTEMSIQSSTSSENTTGHIKPGDKITYTIKVKNSGEKEAKGLELADYFSDYLELESIKVSSKKSDYNLEERFEEKYNVMTIMLPDLKAGETTEIEIIGKVKEDILSDDLLDVTNSAKLYNDSIELNETEVVTYVLESNPDVSQKAEDMGDGNNQNATYNLSGVVWVDENKDGSRDTGEPLLEGVTVYAIDTKTNEIVKGNDGNKITSTTNSDGGYSLPLPKGEYIVVFEYNTQLYTITTYQAEGVLTTKNSDAIKSSLMVDGENKEVAKTDNIKLSSNVGNIDLGLKDANEFNLELKKYVTKMVVTNSKGTNTYDQKDGTTLSKVEIGSKSLTGTNVVIEYAIKITNKGEAAGYVKNIVDYLPSELNFSSSLNSDWYQSGENIYNSSLENTLINPGETKEIKLILTKVMTTSNTGLINNKAEIVDSFSAIGTDRDSENNNGSADVIIGIKTGGVISYILLTITIIAVICGIAYLVNKFILQKKLNI